jgi:sugar transferase (PEP-CTERM/EpsH1 system associated)
MNILYLAHRIPYPPNKGEKIRAYHQVKYLSQRHTLDLVCLIDDPRDLAHVDSLKQFCRRVHAQANLPYPAKVRGFLTQLFGGTVSVGYFYRQSVQKVVDAWLADTAYDAVVCFSSTMAEYVFRSVQLTKRSPHLRLIMDFCDVDSDKWRQYAVKARFPMSVIFRREHRRMQRYERRIHQAFDASVLVSQQEAELFSRLIGTREKVVIISNGIDAQFFQPSLGFTASGPREGSPPVIVFTGAMDYHVNIDGVLWFCNEVLPSVKQYHPQLQFKIVGSNPTIAVQKLAERPGIEVTGFVDDIRPYYAMADVCVAPLHLGRGVQNKVLEAMAMEQAVVATSKANAGIGAKSGAHLLVADSPGGFAVAVNELLTNLTVRKQLGKAARKFVVSNFDWDKNLDVFAALLSANAPEGFTKAGQTTYARVRHGK